MSNTVTSLRSGNKITLHCTARDGAGSVINLTGCDIEFAIFNSAGAEQVSKTIGSGIAVTAAASGTFDVVLDPADTAGLSGLYDCEALITDDDGDPVTIGNHDLSPKQLYFVPPLIS